MTLVSEKIVVIANQYLDTKNINDTESFNEPFFQNKISEYGWELPFAARSIGCELIWKEALKGSGSAEARYLDRMFSPSPIATHANFRGSRKFKTGNVPELGAIALWRKGNGWQGIMGIVINVHDDKMGFDIAECVALQGSENRFLTFERKNGKRADLPPKHDSFNILGFIYPPNREIA